MSYPFRRYADAIDYLDSFISYEKTPPPKYCGTSHYNLDRFRSLLSSIGRPEATLSCIHIAGTDGKGSTAAFLACLLHACGYRVGLYTSPHLFDYTERIQIDGKPIPRRRFTELISLLASKLAHRTAQADSSLEFFSTVFELLTAAAFRYFQDEKVDLAVIETGLGGTLDATNVVKPLVSVLTPIDREHTNLLGKTLRQIAAQKAGIIKAGRPVFSASQKPAALDVIRAICRNQGSPLFLRSDYLRAAHIRPSLEGYGFTLSSPGEPSPGRLICPILGRHQVENLTLALLITQYLLDGCPVHPAPPAKDLLACAGRTLPLLSWPGRSEIHMLPGGIWVLDGAHSPQAARCLRRLLDELFPARPVHHLLATSQDKDVGILVSCLLRPSDRLSCYQSSHPRAFDRRLLKSALMASFPAARVTLGRDITQCLIAKSGRREINCVSGSIFWTADVNKKITALFSSAP